jgi:hypothetical protein
MLSWVLFFILTPCPFCYIKIRKPFLYMHCVLCFRLFAMPDLFCNFSVCPFRICIVCLRTAKVFCVVACLCNSCFKCSDTCCCGSLLSFHTHRSNPLFCLSFEFFECDHNMDHTFWSALSYYTHFYTQRFIPVICWCPTRLNCSYF